MSAYVASGHDSSGIGQYAINGRMHSYGMIRAFPTRREPVMANRTIAAEPDKAGGFVANLRKPLTRYRKGRRWAFWTVVITWTFSAFSNVRSGRIEAEPIAYSVFPIIALFLAIHLIGYLNPKSKLAKVLVYFGLTLTATVAFGMSGYHIYEQAARNGQPWLIALSYPFVVDFPSVIGAFILVMKDETPASRTTTEKPAQAPAKAVKKAVPAKTTPSRTSRPKTTKPTVTPIATEPVMFRQAVKDPDAEIAA